MRRIHAPGHPLERGDAQFDEVDRCDDPMMDINGIYHAEVTMHISSMWSTRAIC
jgi:hypothetical protein